MSDKWKILADLLIENTIDEKIDWEEDDGLFMADLGEYVVSLFHDEGNNRFVVQLRDSGGVIDGFSDDDLIAMGASGYYHKFENIARIIHRRNSGAEKALDEIISKLRG